MTHPKTQSSISPKEDKYREREREREMATTATETTKTSTNGEEQQSQNLRHQEVGHKSLLQSDDLYQVFLSLSQNLGLI